MEQVAKAEALRKLDAHTVGDAVDGLRAVLT
jgi:hypothetical protein